MYQYPYPPPMWYGPPQQNNVDQNTLERGMRIAMKIAQREEREKERKKNNDKKERESARKDAADRARRFWLSVELFIFGIIAQPFVMVGYKALERAVQ